MATPSIAASQRWTESGGVSPNPRDFRYASARPESVTGAPPPTSVPAIVPSTVSAVTELSLAEHALPSVWDAGGQLPGGGSACAGAAITPRANACTNSPAPTAANAVRE
ncbi:hypothetical protein [Mycobacterium shigaense]|uniref:hypothetical protein n=1 Tax=Mycobacterium shigaense TaxID=722731 RepID=UPI000BBAD640|nr:hypothetical protein [Mycobacterium shigaense]MEA1121761.1 hypothetical protein [Mycobacterium shigaense]PRI16014.1 hypothetical protein B2J96_03970 [Mycobacterium shigaense]